MVANSYYLNIPVDQWDFYLKHIVWGIYGIKETQYKVVHESNGIRKIEFATNNQVPLINSLPRTIIRENDMIYFKDKRKLDAIRVAIMDAVKDELITNGSYYIDAITIKLTSCEIPLIIYQLARDKVISKFADLGNNKFIVTIAGYQIAMIIQSVNNKLYVTAYSNARHTFDVDDGYSFILSSLNVGWNKWKEIGDISAPIQPHNIV